MMPGRAPTWSGSVSLPRDADDLLCVIQELVGVGGNPTYQDLAAELDLSLDQVRILIRYLEAAGRIAVPPDAARPIRVIGEPELPDFDVEISLGDWEMGLTDWQIEDGSGST